MSETISSHKKISYACERNKQVILETLTKYLPKSCKVLEIASGSGQHAFHFLSKQSSWKWQPSDPSPEAILSIFAYKNELGSNNFLPPKRLSTLEKSWDVGKFDAIVCCNMLHICSWQECLGLFVHAKKHIIQNGYLILYGPFIEKNIPLAPSNKDFDRSLKKQNPCWGIRELEKVNDTAEKNNFKVLNLHKMPANNLVVIFQKKASS